MNKEQKKKVIRKIGEITLIVIVYTAMLALGFIAGMVHQQALIKNSIIDVLTNTDTVVNVNFNETKLIDGLKEEVVPYMLERAGVEKE